MKLQEAKSWLASADYVRCKEKDTDVIFDAMLWDGDKVIIRETSSDPKQLFIISMDVFANQFNAIGDRDDLYEDALR